MKRLYVFVVLLASILALFIACEKKTTEPKIEFGTLIVSSTPAGARIYLDTYDQKRFTPDTLYQIIAEEHILKLRLEYYEDWGKKVTAKANQETKVHAELVSNVGSLAVFSTPSGAKIYLDDVDIGKETPDTLLHISVGPHLLKLTKDHFADWFKNIQVLRESMITINAILGQETGTVIVKSGPSGAVIWLDSVNTGKTTPDTLYSVSPGSHYLKLTLDGYHDYTTSFYLSKGEIRTIEVTLQVVLPETGTIIVYSLPEGAKIWLDDVNTGKVSPDSLLNVPWGSHDLALKLENYKTYTRYIFLDRGEREIIDVILNPECPGGIVGDLRFDPEITITNAWPSHIYGTANNIDAQKIRVVMWAKTDRWYVQPYIAWPYTDICADGTWDSYTHPWNRLVALLVDSTYTPGATRLYHPSLDPGILAWDEYPERRPDRVIDFSLYPWRVKYSGTEKVGPGDNYFSDSEDNVWVDPLDRLHLKIVYQPIWPGFSWWTSSEVVLKQSLGYGTYTFYVSSRIDNLDFWVTFAGFTYEDWDKELDIELSQFLANPDNAQYVVQPWDRSGNIVRFTMPEVTNSTHQFIWQTDRVEFKSWKGHASLAHPDSVIYSWTYTGADIPPAGGERMRFNLWIAKDKTPSKSDEVIIKSFTFQP